VKLEDGGISAELNGIFLDNGCKNIEVNNFNVNGNLNASGIGKDIVSYSETNIFLNCRNPYLSGNRFTEGIDSSLTKANSYEAVVQDSLGRSIVNAKVYGKRVDGELEFMLRTGVDGKTSKISLIEYINRGGEKEQFAPYTMTAEKGNLSDSHVYYFDNLFIEGKCGGIASYETVDNEEDCRTLEGCTPFYKCGGGDSTVSCEGKSEQQCIQYGCNWNVDKCEGYVPCEHVAASDCTDYGCTNGNFYIGFLNPAPCFFYNSLENCANQSGCSWYDKKAYDKFLLHE
jgi:hypothetical protein